jgi:hypothetical protein
MPNAGRTTTSGNNFWVTNTGSNNQYGHAITMPESGLIQYLDVYMAGSGGAITAVLCLWDSSGALLAQSASFSCAGGAGGINGQAFQRQPLVSAYHAVAATYYVGFWRNGAQTAEFSYISSGGTIHPSAPSGGIANVGSPGNLSFSNSTTGQLSAYVEYVKGGVGLAAGGAFSKYALRRWDSGSSTWKRHPLKRWNASNSTWEWFA